MEPIQRHQHQLPLELSSLISDSEIEANITAPTAIANTEMCELTNKSITEANQLMRELLDSAVESLLASRQEEAMQILQKVERLIEYVSKRESSVETGLKIVCYYNLACVYQQQWVLDRCCHYLQKCIEAMEKYCAEESYSSIKRSTLFIQSILQYCAVLSQSGQHEKALESAKKAIPQIKQIFAYSYELCVSRLREQQNPSAQPEKIGYGGQVLRTALEFLQVLRFLPTYSQMNEQDSQDLEQVRQQIYFWKNNPQNNERLIRKSLGVGPCEETASEERNLLGLQSTESWILTHNIGTIMHIKAMHYDDYVLEDAFMFEMSKRKLLERAMLASVCYFSLSTELRFIEIESAKRNANKAQPAERNSMGQQPKSSQIFHLKAIQVICKFIKQNSVYVNHLITSYHKHYKQNLLVITEEPSMIQYSFIQKPPEVAKDSPKAEGSTDDATQSRPNEDGRSKKVMGYQPFSKRQIKHAGNMPEMKLSAVVGVEKDLNSQPQRHKGLRVKLSSKSKEKSIPTITYEDGSKGSRPSEDTHTQSKRELSSKLKSTHRSSKRLEIITKQEMFMPKAKSKSHSRLNNKSRDKAKKPIKVKNDRNILIEGDCLEQPSSDPFEKITHKNMEFLSKQFGSPQYATVSLTKKAFKKPVGRYAEVTESHTDSSSNLHK